MRIGNSEVEGKGQTPVIIPTMVMVRTEDLVHLLEHRAPIKTVKKLLQPTYVRELKSSQLQ
jgi:hypothetical protein